MNSKFKIFKFILKKKRKKKPQIFSSPIAENMTGPGGNMAEEAGN